MFYETLGLSSIEAFARIQGKISMPLDSNRINAVLALATELVGLTDRSDDYISYRKLGAVFRDLVKRELEMQRQSFIATAPLGLCFQIAPSNTVVTAVYFALFAFLAGNFVVTKLPGGSNSQISPLAEAFSRLPVDQQQHLQNGLAFIWYEYENNPAYTAFLSGNCDIRVVWGSCSTVSSIRQIPMKGTAVDIAFPSRFSLAIIDAREYASQESDVRDKVVSRFMSDSFFFDHNACSSPKALVWLDSTHDDSLKNDLWNRVSRQFKEQRSSDYWFYSRTEESFALNAFTFKAEMIRFKKYFFGYLFDVCNIKSAIELVPFEDIRFGTFMQFSISELSELKYFSHPQLQTISFYGVDAQKIHDLVIKGVIGGCFRVVPFGSALDLKDHWDGLNLLKVCTKKVELRLA